MRSILVAALAAACVLTAAAAGAGTDKVNPKGNGSGNGNQESVDQIVMARRNVMAAIGRHMDEINGMLEPGRTLDPHEATEQADEIAVLLMAFPNLFPQGSNNWSKAKEQSDPARVTEASPAVWSEAKAFRAQALATSQLATDASRAKDADSFRQLAKALDANCAGCHAKFRREEKPYVIPIGALK